MHFKKFVFFLALSLPLIFTKAASAETLLDQLASKALEEIAAGGDPTEVMSYYESITIFLGDVTGIAQCTLADAPVTSDDLGGFTPGGTCNSSQILCCVDQKDRDKLQKQLDAARAKLKKAQDALAALFAQYPGAAGLMQQFYDVEAQIRDIQRQLRELANCNDPASRAQKAALIKQLSAAKNQRAIIQKQLGKMFPPPSKVFDQLQKLVGDILNALDEIARLEALLRAQACNTPNPDGGDGGGVTPPVVTPTVTSVTSGI